MSGCFKRQRGFTLIELLVVIAVIAVLIGILLPALGRARSTARALTDKMNLRSLQQGVEMYLNTYETYPPFRMPEGSIHKATKRPRPRFHWFLGEQVGQPFLPKNEEEVALLHSTDSIPRLDNEVFRDPTQTLEAFRNSGGDVRALRNGSYGYNYHYLGNARTDAPDPVYDNFPVKSNNIRTFARTISLADSLGNQTIFANSGFREHSYTLDPPRLDIEGSNAQRFGPDSGKSPGHARHMGFVNVAFLDGHVEALTLAQMGYVVVDAGLNQVAENDGSNALFNGRGFDTTDQDETTAP